jgi:DNA-directed RNA polymerase subunit RPC12/RpoP
MYALIPLMNSTDDSKADFQMKGLWAGSSAAGYHRNINFTWTINQTDGFPAAHIADISQENSLYMARDKTLGVYVNYYWTAMANALEYKAGADGFDTNEYYTENFITWKRYSGDEMGKGGTAMWPSNTFEKTAVTPVYVINYAPLKNAVENVVSVIASNPSAYVNNADKTINMLADVDAATSFDPNTSFQSVVNHVVKSNVIDCAGAILGLIQNIYDVVPTAKINTDYTILENAVNKYKSVYDGNNADLKYTADSFAAFKTAYEDAIAAAQAVAEDGFTSTEAGKALNAAYGALNVQPFDTGSSGNTDYDYDATTGTLTITPQENTDGKMADYATADDSPFGNNPDITEVVIDPSVTYIGSHAFDGASNLTTITVPAGATYGEGAFNNCPNLKTVIIVNGEVGNASAANAPWLLTTVNVIKLGTDAEDKSITAIGDSVFTAKENTAFYVYNEACDIPSVTNHTFGSNPTIHGANPSTAYTYHQTYSDATTFVQINHGEHVWTLQDRVSPACEKQGYDLYKCSVCGETKMERVVGPIGHSWDEGTVTSPATCTTAGTIVYTCQNDASHKQYASIPATGHTWIETSSTASCTKAGEITETCKGCGITRTQIVTEPLGHNYVPTVVPPTCTDLGYTIYVCSRCGDMYNSDYVAPTGDHTWDAGTVIQQATCTKRGEILYTCQNDMAHTKIEYVDPIGHDWDDGVVTKEATVEEEGVITYTCKNDASHKMTKPIPKAKKAPVPTTQEAQKAPVNKSIKKITGITTVSGSKKKIMTVSWTKVSGAQNYYVAFRKAGDKMWNYYWTGGKAKYVFKNLKTNGLYEFKFAAFKKINGKWQRGDWSKTSYRYYKKATLKKLTTKKKSIKVTWQRDKNCNYYVIFYATKKDMSNQKKITVKGNKKTSYTIKKLKKGKKYYVRVRAYKTKNKKNYAGELSSKKNIKVK